MIFIAPWVNLLRIQAIPTSRLLSVCWWWWLLKGWGWTGGRWGEVMCFFVVWLSARETAKLQRSCIECKTVDPLTLPIDNWLTYQIGIKMRMHACSAMQSTWLNRKWDWSKYISMGRRYQFVSFVIDELRERERQKSKKELKHGKTLLSLYLLSTTCLNEWMTTPRSLPRCP